MKRSKIEQENQSFHQCVGHALVYGQFFGMLPVSGVLSKDENRLEFRWKSLKTIYSMTFLLFGSIESCLGIRRLLRLGFNINFAEGLLFFLTAMIRAFIIFRLAKNWKAIIRKWRLCEDAFLKSPYQVKGWRLSTRIKVIFSILAALGMGEHIFFMVTAISDNHLQITQCTPKFQIFWKNFLSRYRPHLLHHFPYSPYELPLYEWVNLLQSFSWNYADILITVIALGISFRFKQFNDYFKFILQNESLMSPALWRDLRVDYFLLVDLVHFIDSQISGLILISMGHNMLILVIKIFNAFNPTRYNTINNLYFWFYVSFLILRTMSVLFSSASINEAARESLNYIRRVPSRFWTLDLKRLSDTIEVETPTLALSGKQFFYITKGLILAMTGAIVTFEIILLDEVAPPNEDLCALIDY